MNNKNPNQSQQTVKSRIIFLWGTFALILAFALYAVRGEIQGLLSSESYTVPHTEYRDLAIALTLALIWLIFFYKNTPALKNGLRRIPRGIKYILTGAILSAYSGHFTFLILYISFGGVDFYGFFDYLGYIIVSSGIFSAFIAGIIFLLNKNKEKSSPIGLVIACILGVILSFIILAGLLPQ